MLARLTDLRRSLAPVWGPPTAAAPPAPPGPQGDVPPPDAVEAAPAAPGQAGPAAWRSAPPGAALAPAACDVDLEVPGLGPRQRAFNAGLARHRGHLVLAFRLETRGGPLGPDNQIACINLGADLRPRGAFDVLATPRIPHTLHTAEDPRLLDHDGRLLVVFNMSDNGRADGPRHMHLGLVDTEPATPGLTFRLAASWQLLFTAPGRGVQPVEKNWTPFSHGGAVHFGYQTSPHLVIRLAGEALARPSGTTLFPAALPRLSTVRFLWPAGLPRGGSQAVYDAALDRFVTFFHSSWADRGLTTAGGEVSRTYLFGCLTFQPLAPFDVDKVSGWPLVTPGLIRELLRPAEADGKRILFVAGLVVEPASFLLSLGRGDRCISLCRLGRADVLASLRPVPRAVARGLAAART